jgi:hypothetical protein
MQDEEMLLLLLLLASCVALYTVPHLKPMFDHSPQCSVPPTLCKAL